MWAVLGFLIAATIGFALVLAASRSGSVQRDRYPWMLYETARLHVGIIGNLAGFAFTGIILVVTLAGNRPGIVASSLDNVIVMFLVAYLFWVGAGYLISFIPHADTSGDFVPRVHFSLATTIEFRTVFLSWFALLPLLDANGLGRLDYVFYFLVPGSLVPGSVLVAMALDSLGLIRVWETYLSAAVGVGLALAYTALVAFAAHGARSPYSPVYVALVIFCLNSVSFGLAALTPLSPKYVAINRFYEQHGRRFVIADMQLSMLSLMFLWLSVVKAI